jgi:hypothetical protein
VTEIQEDVEYRVEFIAGGHVMAIQVSLSPEFPLEKPVLKVSPQIDHPWVNEQCEIISAPGLLNVSGQLCPMQHSGSGAVWWCNSEFILLSSQFTLIWAVLCRQLSESLNADHLLSLEMWQQECPLHIREVRTTGQ